MVVTWQNETFQSVGQGYDCLHWKCIAYSPLRSASQIPSCSTLLRLLTFLVFPFLIKSPSFNMAIKACFVPSTRVANGPSSEEIPSMGLLLGGGNLAVGRDPIRSVMAQGVVVATEDLPLLGPAAESSGYEVA